jgi:hypothetical protein
MEIEIRAIASSVGRHPCDEIAVQPGCRGKRDDATFTRRSTNQAGS